MGYTVLKSGSRYNIVNTQTGKVVGASNNRKKAEASAKVRGTSDANKK